MSNPSTLSEDTSIIQRLFEQLPSAFSREEEPRDILTFSFVDSTNTIFSQSTSSSFISFSIKDFVLNISSNIVYIESEHLDLSQFTFDSLSNYFNYKYFYQGLKCTISSQYAFTDSNLPATMLCEGGYFLTGPFSTSSSLTISRFTSNNFSLISSLALSLLDNNKKMTSTLGQIDLRVASGYWLDYWGHLLGIDRNTTDIENDDQYRLRIQFQSLGVRSTNLGIQKAVSTSVQRKCFVSDGGKPYVFSGSYTSSANTPLPSIGTIYPSYLWISTATSLTSTTTVGSIRKNSVESTAVSLGIPMISTTAGLNTVVFSSVSSTFVDFFKVGAIIDGYKLIVPDGTTAAFEVGKTYTVIALPSNNPQQALRSVAGFDPANSAITFTTNAIYLSTTNVLASRIPVATIGSSFVAANTGTTATNNNYSLAGGKFELNPFPDNCYITNLTVSNTSDSTSKNITVTLSNKLLYTLESVIVNIYAPQWSIPSEKLGPTTGSGTFAVRIQLNSNETTLPQPVISAATSAINAWRPAGMPYVIQSY
ncbi:hypothetical protein EBS67_00105 [bacterium]|nr:hypothetical protein [bacterium]NBT61892.1 hypothetical protein [Planctomycetia bacterium]